MWTTFLWPLRFGWLLVLSFFKEDYLQIFKFVSFWLHGYCGKWEGWALVNRFNNTSWVTAVTPTDRPTSVRNRCVIKVFVGVFFMLSRCCLDFSVRVGAFVIWLSQISSFPPLSDKIVDIPKGTKCALFLPDTFLYSYEAEFIQSLLSVGKEHLASHFNFTPKYIDYVMSINNPDFEKYLDILMNLRSKTRRRAIILLLTWMYSCQSGMTVNSTPSLRQTKRVKFPFHTVFVLEKQDSIFAALREKERDLTQSYDKSPYTDRKIQKATWQHKNATKNFDCTTIADRLRTVNWGNESYPTGAVKPVNGITTLPLTTTVV